LEAGPETLRKALDQLGFVYLFAPAYHPAFKGVGPARRALAARGQRSVFNVLGPLVNPGRPGRILLGVYPEGWTDRLVVVLDALGSDAGLAAHVVLHGGRGIDELTAAGVNRV